jgi:hypothetical protein
MKNDRGIQIQKKRINQVNIFVINDAAIDGVMRHSWDGFWNETSYPTFFFCKFDWRVYEDKKIWHAKDRDKQLKRKGYIPYCKVSFWDIVVSYMKMEEPEYYQYVCEHDTPKQSKLQKDITLYLQGDYYDAWFDEYLKHRVIKSLMEWCDENELPCEVIDKFPLIFWGEKIKKFFESCWEHRVRFATAAVLGCVMYIIRSSITCKK